MSVSFRTNKGVVPTSRWLRGQHQHAERLIDQALGDLGDRNFERAFRMCITTCRHRVLNAAERAQLPVGFARSARDIAGCPVEVLWSRGIPPELDASRPCDLGRLKRVPPGVLVPDPCGSCAACQANEEARERVVTLHKDRENYDPLGTR